MVKKKYGFIKKVDGGYLANVYEKNKKGDFIVSSPKNKVFKGKSKARAWLIKKRGR